MDFLRDMTSQQGKNLITGPHKTRLTKNGDVSWDQHWVDFSDDVAVQRAIDSVEQECKGVYYALGSFKRFERLSHASSNPHRTFW